MGRRPETGRLATDSGLLPNAVTANQQVVPQRRWKIRCGLLLKFVKFKVVLDGPVCPRSGSRSAVLDPWCRPEGRCRHRLRHPAPAGGCPLTHARVLLRPPSPCTFVMPVVCRAPGCGRELRRALGERRHVAATHGVSLLPAVKTTCVESEDEQDARGDGVRRSEGLFLGAGEGIGDVVGLESPVFLELARAVTTPSESPRRRRAR